MILEAGKFYRNRKGEKVGPIHVGDSRCWEKGKIYRHDPEWYPFGTPTNYGLEYCGVDRV